MRIFISGINGYFFFPIEVFPIWLDFPIVSVQNRKDGGMIKTLFFLAPKVWILPMKYESLFSAGPLCFPSTSSLLTCLGCSKVLVWQHPWILFLVESPLLGATQNNWTLSGLWSAGSKEGSARCENPKNLEHTHHLILHFSELCKLGHVCLE